MRIITGIAKGAKLRVPPGLDVRPTADRVKESIFNILGSLVAESIVLDLFAGTGNLGLEALSRGARKAVFIDKSMTSLAIVKQNIAHTKLGAKAEVYRNDALRALDKLAREGRVFDLLFCDPPYNKGLVAAVLDKLDNIKLLASGGIVVIEHSKHETIGKEWKTLQHKRTEYYGETLVSFLIKRNQEE